MKVWLTTKVERSTRGAIRHLAEKRGMKMGPLIDRILWAFATAENEGSAQSVEGTIIMGKDPVETR